jgi:hypothetical protein
MLSVFSLSEAGSFACISSQGDEKAKSNDGKKHGLLY